MTGYEHSDYYEKNMVKAITYITGSLDNYIFCTSEASNR